MQPFHLAIPVTKLEECRIFYRDILQCSEGRSDTHWVDFNLYGHQLVIHESAQTEKKRNENPVDGHDVPIPHFGVILKWNDWQLLADRLKNEGIKFVIEPYIRFKGEIGEQATMFFLDPSGNALEFKAFKDMNQVFAK